jgi:hypothetical protein
LCITEPYAGSDVTGLRTEAKKTPDGKYYIVNGEKKWITNGIFADYFTVACRTGGPGMNGTFHIHIHTTITITITITITLLFLLFALDWFVLFLINFLFVRNLVIVTGTNNAWYHHTSDELSRCVVIRNNLCYF